MRVKVVCPYTDLRAETYRACSVWPDVTFVYVGDSDTAYAELLARLWQEGRSFIVCEHDVVPNPGQLAEMAACPHPYCCVPTALRVYIAPCLSLTKFAAPLLAELPDVMERVLRVPTRLGRDLHEGPPGHWSQLDTVLQRTVLLNRYSRQPHLHLPPATHLNPDKGTLLPGARLLPGALRLQIPSWPALAEPA